MAVGKGGSANNQRQNQSGSFTSAGSSTSTTTGTSASTSTPIAPEGWQVNWGNYQPGAGGFTPTQQTGVDWMQGALASPDPANLAPANNRLNFVGGYMDDALKHRGAPTLAALAASGNPAYATPADVTAQQIAARQGSEFISDYQNPFLSDVLDTSLADFDVGVDRAGNSFRAANIAGGASGAGVNPVGAAILAGEAARGRGALSSGIRSNAFTTAAGLGMQDANRFLTADSTNAANKLAADTFNNQQQQARNMFDAQLGMQYNDQRDRLARDIAGVAGQQAALGTTGFGVGQGLATGLIGAGTTGQSQNLDWLNAGLPLFGQSNTGTVNETTSGTTNESGSTAGNSSGSARGKSGGVSF